MKNLVLSMILVSSSIALASVGIIGGNKISTKDAPWQLSLKSRLGGSHYCGAALVSRDMVLTAAHCVYKQAASELKIYGSSSSGHIDSLKRLPSASRLILHPRFDPDDVTAHDLAIIKLSRPVEVSATLMPASLPEPNGPFQIDREFHLLLGYPMFISGWGSTTPPNRFPTASDDLMRAFMKPLASSNISLQDPDIQRYLEETYDVGARTRARIIGEDSKTLITEGLEGRAGSCSGDSGGPLVMNLGGQFFLLGISSYTAGGERMCKGVSVYTNVQAYRNWIAEYE